MSRTIITERDTVRELEEALSTLRWADDQAGLDSEIEHAEQEGKQTVADALRLLPPLQPRPRREDFSSDEEYRQALFSHELTSGPEPHNPAPYQALRPDDYTGRLLKYIPAESIALYLTLQGIILSGAAEAPNLNTWLWFILGIGLIGTALYQWRALKIEKVVQVAISTAAFGVWVFALGGAFASLSWYEPFIGSLALVIFTFFAPLVKPDVLITDQE